MFERYPNLQVATEGSIEVLKQYGRLVDVEHWQGIETQGKPDLQTKEIINLNFSSPMPPSQERAEYLTRANMPWAEVEFLERVGGEPHNPHASLDLWPFWNPDAEAASTENKIFTHTYSERFWPHIKGHDRGPKGIRYEFGDLDDVIALLRKYPHTRQATFPIFFPEDTGAVHGGRIPCTLHYHFLMRSNALNLWYPIRSCDAYRHFRDDLYMATRLAQWVLDELRERELRDTGPQVWVDVEPGHLFFTAYSFHVHMGDLHKL